MYLPSFESQKKKAVALRPYTNIAISLHFTTNELTSPAKHSWQLIKQA